MGQSGLCERVVRRGAGTRLSAARRVCAAGATLAALALLLAAGPAQALRIDQFTPQGEVALVRQLVARFSDAAVAAGAQQAGAPLRLICNGGAPAGSGRWTSEREWVFELAAPLPPGQRCSVEPMPGWTPLQGRLEGPSRFSFATGGPAILRSEPGDGATVDEDQHWLLRLSGAALPASVTANAWCEVDGIGERIALRLVDGAPREQVLKARRVAAAEAARSLLVTCGRPLPPGAKLRLVWGAGIASAAPAADGPIVTRQPQRLRFDVRPAFQAEFSCEREQARAPCMPLRPLRLRFSAPVPREQLAQVRLQPLAGGAALAPRLDADGNELDELQFAAPLAPDARYRLTLPAALRDASGRPLRNAASFPLELATGPMPPIAKFAAAPFGIVEAGPEAMLPLTLRHLQPELRPGAAAPAGTVRVKTIAPAQWLQWLGRVQRYHESEVPAREAGRPGKDPVATRELSLLAGDREARPLALPQLQGGEPRPFEVVGIPLAEPGYHVVEIESPGLGARLLAKAAPMYVRTGVLVTNLGLHFKRGRDDALVWVTTLDRGQPVDQAEVAVQDCDGRPLWSGRTDAQGLARVPLALPEIAYQKKCTWQRGYFVTAAKVERGPDGRERSDRAFVYSHWHRGIEPWRFGLPVAWDGGDGGPALRAHTVFDRTLLRAGETVAMKHLLRAETGRGLADAPREALPTQLKIVHLGSGDEVVQPLAFDAAGRAALSSWAIPATARLGLYEVRLVGAAPAAARGGSGRAEWTSGQFRVEAFRVPLLDARLSPPKGPQVAPSRLDFGVQLNYQAGGGVARAPLQASALLRERALAFPGYERFSFEPPREPGERDAAEREGGGDDDGPRSDGARLVLDKQALATDGRGAATLRIDKLAAVKRPSELQVELGFDDPNGERQTATARLPLWPAARIAGIRSGSWAAAQGRVKFQALLLDLQGRPVAGGQLAVQGRVTRWLATRKRLVGGFYAYEQRPQRQDLGTLCAGRSDERGLLLCDAAIAAAGEVELVARGTDEAGRVSEAATTLWVSRSGEGWFEQDNDDRIDVLADKAEYAPGDVARLQVRMPYRQATTLVAVEREGVLQTRVVTLRGDDPVVELPIPKGSGDDAASWAPNVFVSVLAVRGRVREVPWYSFFQWGWRDPGDWWRAFRFEGREWRAPTAMVDLAKPSHKFGVAQLKIGLAAHRLQVQVTPERTQYAVRQTVKTQVLVRLPDGRPAAGAEIAFAAVDEGLLALMDNRSWDLLPAMFPPRAWAVETATAQGEIIGRRHYGRKAVPAGGGGGRNPTRELFDTLLLWRGAVTLDARGEALIDVPLNDALTSFRLVAVASAGADRFGSGSATVRVSQDLQLLPGLPSLVRAGDRYDAVFTLRNTTAQPMTVDATLAASAAAAAPATAARTLAFPTQKISVPAQGAAELRWTVEVPAGVAQLQFEARAQQAGGAARDQLKLAQAVLPAVPVRVVQATLQPLDGALQWPLAPPADALAADPAQPNGPRAGGLQIGLQPTLAGAPPGLQRWFEQYPFNCLEQQTDRVLALRDAAGWARLAASLPGYLDGDGLAQYYPLRDGEAARGSDRLTAHLVAAAHEAGQAWPEPLRERMLQGLAAFVEGRLQRQPYSPAAARGLDLDVRKLAAIEALSRHGRAAPRQLQSIELAPERWPTAALIDWWRILQRLDGVPQRAQRLEQVQSLLRARLSYAGTVLKFSREDEDFWWWLMDSADANAARLILAAIAEPAWRAELPRLVNGALGRQQRGAWLTTTANLWGALALRRFGEAFENAAVAGRSSAQLGAARAQLDWAATPAGGALALPWPAAAASAPSTLLLQHQGSGRPWVTLQALAAQPLAAPRAAGYRVSRSLSAVQQQTPGVWRRGDLLRVRVEIEAAADMAWVALLDPLPAGAAVQGRGLGRDSALATRGERREGSAWLAWEEHGADAYRASWEFMPRGRHVLEYTLRLNTVGRFQLPPTRVEAMYAPDRFGEAPNAVLEVRP